MSCQGSGPIKGVGRVIRTGESQFAPLITRELVEAATGRSGDGEVAERCGRARRRERTMIAMTATGGNEELGATLALCNAIMNGTSAALLLCGWIAIRRGRRDVHWKLMAGAFTVTGLSPGRHVLRVEKAQFAPGRVEAVDNQAAVKQWQREHGVVSAGNPWTTGYGAVGPRTRAAMAAACGATTP